MPVRCPIQEYLNRLHRECEAIQTGEVATYIPELARADKSWFGICLAATNGHLYEVGDTRQPFTIQSISKALVYGIALEDNGEDAVLQRVSVEPTGEPFNSISLDPHSGRPLNPMINAGAIAVAGLVAGATTGQKFHRILRTFSDYAGRDLTVDLAVCESEKSTGHRNRAIVHMLRSFDIIGAEPEQVLDLYFRQCSISVDCRDLAVMAATLANGGVNPCTGRRAAPQECVGKILSLMATCGMYDFAGEWMYQVGIPAKSGVGGGILAVLPGQLGIGVFSPALDLHGNSVRGIEVCRAISRDFGLHLFNVRNAANSVIRYCYDSSQMSSRRLRPGVEGAILKRLGSRIIVYELQGDLTFTFAEPVVRDILERAERIGFVILDLNRVVTLDDAASGLLVDLGRNLAEREICTLFANAATRTKLIERLASLETPPSARLMHFGNLDSALEWCEDRLIRGEIAPQSSEVPMDLAEHEMCRGLTAEECGRLLKKMSPMNFASGETIVREGDAPLHIYLLLKGEVTVTIRDLSGKAKRVSTLSPGMVFGEMSAIDRRPRSADVCADSQVLCYALPLEEFDGLNESHPRMKAILLENILRHVSSMLRRLNQEVSALAR